MTIIVDIKVVKGNRIINYMSSRQIFIRTKSGSLTMINLKLTLIQQQQQQ